MKDKKAKITGNIGGFVIDMDKTMKKMEKKVAGKDMTNSNNWKAKCSECGGIMDYYNFKYGCRKCGHIMEV